ncbi:MULTISPECIES: hypothetical protein [Pseudomonas syringae group]|uniref:hypothetical protein n=1 Tax=Pseudomonas syringae group TaxID=136849 RepID=UPI000463C752|nr:MULTISPECIES: hypothetical protein [Pseudomonas syringae group]RMV72795.1 hypothetical protein ALP06_01097 [Pseudomonas coronafaciens pv. atropurpurea]
MKLYHYTSVPLAEAIFFSSLRIGQYKTEKGMTFQCVWLTENPAPEGHGLLTGEQLTTAQVERLRNRGEAVANNQTHDKTQVRIELDSSNLSSFSIDAESRPHGLIRYVELSEMVGDQDLYRKYMGLSCYCDMATVTDEQLVFLMKNQPTQEEGWWLYFGEISSELFSGVSFMQSDIATPYSFESHGRSVVDTYGLHIASEPALTDLHQILPRLGRFDTPKALAFCREHDSKPSINFQWDKSIWDISLDGQYSTNLIFGELPENISLVIDWMSSNDGQLQALWLAAVESYNRFYPDKPRA